MAAAALLVSIKLNHSATQVLFTNEQQGKFTYQNLLKNPSHLWDDTISELTQLNFKHDI